MLRFIFFAVLIYLVYLGLKAFLSKFSNLKKTFGGDNQNNVRKEKYTKSDLNNIEDADFKEIKKN